MKRTNEARDAAMLDLADYGATIPTLVARFGMTRNAVIGALWRARRRLAPKPHPEPSYTPTLNKAPMIPRTKPGPISRGYRTYT